MYPSCLFSIILFLFVTQAGTYKPIPPKGSTKAGTCPDDHALCKNVYPGKCESDKDCDGNQKCCFYYCHFNCRYTVEERFLVVKEGLCPDTPGQCGKKPQANNCTRDGDCRGLYKCCPGACGNVCRRPLSGKLGTCPEIVYQCTREPPPDKCQRDRDCPGTFRCCPHFCGKKCLDALNPNLPVFAKETVEKIKKLKAAREARKELRRKKEEEEERLNTEG